MPHQHFYLPSLLTLSQSLHLSTVIVLAMGSLHRVTMLGQRLRGALEW